jgi:hypothetical protein
MTGKRREVRVKARGGKGGLGEATVELGIPTFHMRLFAGFKADFAYVSW